MFKLNKYESNKMIKYILGNGGFAQELFEQVFVRDESFGGFIIIRNGIVYIINGNGVNKFTYPEDAAFILGTGNKKWRKEFIEHFTSKYENNSKHFPNIIANESHISSLASMGIGNVFCSFSMLNANASIGDFNCLNIYSSINHDCKVGNNNVLSPYASLMGYCKMGNENFLGVSTHITPKCTLGNENTLSAGEILFDDMNSREFFQSGIITKKP